MPLRDLCVAIPVGGIVNETYLEYNLQMLRDAECLIYVGVDSQESLLSLGNYSSVRRLIDQYADHVLEFPPESYYRPGSIWKKIFDCWKASKAPYLRALGYDDYLPVKLLEEQHSFMLANPAIEASYSNQLVVDEVQACEKFTHTYLSPFNRIRAIGKNWFSFICWEVRADYILCEEFEQKLMRGCHCFENLMHAYLLKGNSLHFNSVKNASAVRREHHHTISHLAQQGILTELDDKSKAIREITGYSTAQTESDWRSLDFHHYVQNIRYQLSPLRTLLARLEDKVRGVPYLK
jgi:hypothetical protein